MLITKDYKTFIEKLICSNKRYSGNEDLLEDFCSEVLERSYSLVKNVDDFEKITPYLNKVVSTSIIKVLKNSGRLIRSSSGYEKPDIVSTSGENPFDDGILDIDDPSIRFTQEVDDKETLQEIYNFVIALNEKYPSENFLKIFEMKYIFNKKQREISKALGISQGEVSKRLFNLMERINSNIQGE